MISSARFVFYMFCGLMICAEVYFVACCFLRHHDALHDAIGATTSFMPVSVTVRVIAGAFLGGQPKAHLSNRMKLVVCVLYVTVRAVSRSVSAFRTGRWREHAEIFVPGLLVFASTTFVTAKAATWARRPPVPSPPSQDEQGVRGARCVA